MIVFPAMPVRNACVNVVFNRQIFSTQECDRIVSSAVPDGWEEALVGRNPSGEFGEVPAVRSNRQQRLPVDAGGFPISRICQEVSRANSEGWQFDLAGIVADDVPWIMRYDSEGRGHNDWHVDIGQGANASRKLGFSLQLSDPGSYDGGDLEFHNVAVEREALRRAGTLIIFPAYWLHRVTPVTRGSRHVVVGWMHGPSFR